eukprot:c18619_g1_i1.p1 GENE.c18619_g1_i1~~c18619_g1_i1.p1  ORF type:complete len:601 (+),score=43.92 c18619_g1_i1:1-1803(+)
MGERSSGEMLLALLVMGAFADPVTQTKFECALNKFFDQTLACRRSTGCNDILQPMFAAMANYGITQSPSRVVAFTATVMHETDIFRTFLQPIDLGAGALHMLPANLEVACTHIEAFNTAVRQNASSCFSGDFCQCATPERLANVVNESLQLAFDTGAWWFPEGSFLISQEAACENLNIYADDGLGTAGTVEIASKASCNFATGFFRVSCCVFGGLSGGIGMEQRTEYYQGFRSALTTCLAQPDASTTPSPSPAPHKAGSSLPLSLTNIIIIAAGGGSVVLCAGLCFFCRWRQKKPMTVGAKRKRQYKTYDEFLVWIRQTYPDFTGEMPENSHYWPRDDVEMFIKNYNLLVGEVPPPSYDDPEMYPPDPHYPHDPNYVSDQMPLTERDHGPYPEDMHRFPLYPPHRPQYPDERMYRPDEHMPPYMPERPYMSNPRPPMHDPRYPMPQQRMSPYPVPMSRPPMMSPRQPSPYPPGPPGEDPYRTPRANPPSRVAPQRGMTPVMQSGTMHRMTPRPFSPPPQNPNIRPPHARMNEMGGPPPPFMNPGPDRGRGSRGVVFASAPEYFPSAPTAGPPPPMMYSYPGAGMPQRGPQLYGSARGPPP